MDVQSLEADAHAAALKQVALMLQRPDQLEKLETFKKRTARRKAAVEAMLKTAVQSQLEGVRTGLGQLQAAAEDVKTIGESLDEIFELLEGFGPLQEKLAPLRAENMKHSQYAAAKENLKHIFNVPETIEKTQKEINECRLLNAHKNLMELETARDDLMFEVHKLQSQSDKDKSLLKSYFSEVEKLAQELAKQVWLLLGRTLDSVRGTQTEPHKVVTALRIIEREERIDQFCAERHAQTGFMPVGRPRRWRRRAFEVLEKVVQQRVEGNQLEDRDANKHWLARYLETCRVVISEDLRVAKGGCPAIFPPEYEIYSAYVRMYHRCLSTRLREIASEKLEKNELVQLLSWVQAYGGDQMLGKPALQIDVPAVLAESPLLPKTTLNELEDRFLELTKKDISDWLDKSLQQEKDDWYKSAKSEEDSQEHLYTALPAILFQMVEDQVQLAKEISTELIPSVVLVHVEELLVFAGRYRDAAKAFTKKHFEDRSRFQLFTQTMIAAANNCDICVESTEKLKKHVRLTIEVDAMSSRVGGGAVQRQELLKRVDRLKDAWLSSCHSAVGCLLQEVCQDLGPLLSKLMTKAWLEGDNALDTICETIADYNQDHRQLKPHILSMLLMDIQFVILGQYIKAIENRRVTFSSFEERRAAGDRLKREAQRMRDLFDSMTAGQDAYTFEPLTEVLPAAAEVLCLRDKSLLALETSGFVRKFADVTADQLSALIQLREDVGRSEARRLAEETLSHNRLRPKQQTAFTTLFGGGRNLPDFDE